MNADRKRKWLSITGLRLGAAFAALLALFAAALVVMLATLGRLAQADAELDQLDRAKHTGHRAAALLREQYIQQMHAILQDDHNVTPAYQQAVRATRVATAELALYARTREEEAHSAEIARLAQRSDETFRTQLLPALERGGRREAIAVQERAEALVTHAVRLNERLNMMFERRSAAARENTSALRREARVATLVFFALAIAVAATVGFLITRSILNRVSALRAGALRVGAGDLEARISVPGRDEFAELAGVFNQMTADLARHQKELVRTQQLASIGQVAAGVAHEINNPIGVILGYAKLMRRRGPEIEEVRIIQEEAEQCKRIVQGLLDLARPPRLRLTEVDLADLARDAFDRLEEAGLLEGLTLVPPQGDTAALARGDETRLRQVVWNIVQNAAEATPRGGTISIAARRVDGEAVLDVIDSGPGMPRDVARRAFEPFFTTKPKGTGLGLAIAQAIVEAHGGRIDIRANDGPGTRVSLHIPAADGAAVENVPE